MSDGMVVVSTKSRHGFRLVEFRWEGGEYCEITRQFVENADPAYFHRTNNYMHVGPFKLKVLAFIGELDLTACFYDRQNWHNRLVPKIYPLYVRWIEFWRWFVTGIIQ